MLGTTTKGIAVIGVWASGLSMIGLFLAGIVKILLGVGESIRSLGEQGLADVLKGIEYLFLAPLTLLAYISMVLFVQSYLRAMLDTVVDSPHTLVPTGTANATSASTPVERDEPPSAAMVHKVKLALAFLVIAILLTDLVEKALTNRTTNWLSLAGECAAILLGLGYALVIHHVDQSH